MSYVLFVFLISEILFFTGCRKENGSTAPSTNNMSGLYGTGLLSFESTGIDSGFSVNGAYKPSNQFANDTLSFGSGGFIKDTMLFGKKIKTLITAYEHRLSNSTLNERHILIALTDTTSGLPIGDYAFSRLNSTSQSMAAYIYYFLSDSVNFFQMFVPKSGKITITSYDIETKNIKGIFDGILYSMPPDTSRQIEILNGKFDIYLSNKYFNY
ncbi:MAG: hypothetical protein HY964_01140 [Ignavibacteriales bacterium]|nr:hypothetical protein [Ignavibacteriales bacterium]